MKIALCQEDITNTIAKYEFLEDFSLPSRIKLQVIRNGRKENAHLDTYHMESISIKKQFKYDYLKLVNHDNDEIFIMKYHEGFGFYKWSAESLEEVHFENYENFNFHSDVTNVSCCQLTSCKYLVLFYSEDTLVDRPVPFLSVSYQEVFINHVVWMLVDLKAHRVKRVHPSVYDLGKKNLCNDDLEETDGFQKVKFNKRGGKKGKQERFVKYLPDGDLNGGYTDTVLLDSLKHSKHDPIDPISLIPKYDNFIIKRMSTKLILLFVAAFLACLLMITTTTNALSCYQSNYIGGSFFYTNVSDTSSDATCSRYKVKCTSSSDTSAEGCSASDISNGVYKTYCILTTSTNCNYIKSQSQYTGQICCKTDFCNDPNSSASGVVGQFGKLMIGIVMVGALLLL